MSFLIPSERFVLAAVACDAFLFTMQLKDETLADFREAAALFADTRNAIAKGSECEN